MRKTSNILALDAASPVVSVAVADSGGVLASRSVELRRSSRRIMGMVDEVLEDAGLRVTDLTGLVALRGPGSFTGLRVGLATLYGLHQALGTPATAVPTLETLAFATRDRAGERKILAAVDVIRGEWAVQTFSPDDPPRAQDEARRVPAEDLAGLGPAVLAGFGVAALDLPEDCGLEPWEPESLAPAAALAAVRHPPEWNPELLTEPLYFRPPSVSLPKRR